MIYGKYAPGYSLMRSYYRPNWGYRRPGNITVNNFYVGGRWSPPAPRYGYVNYGWRAAGNILAGGIIGLGLGLALGRLMA